MIVFPAASTIIPLLAILFAIASATPTRQEYKLTTRDNDLREGHWPSYGSGRYLSRRRLYRRTEECEEAFEEMCKTVEEKHEEAFELAMKRYKRVCEKAGILVELRSREHYETPCAKRKRKAAAAQKRKDSKS